MKAREDESKLIGAYHYALKSPEGQAVLKDLEKRWMINEPLGVRSEAEMYYRAALRDAWAYIKERIGDE